jgi:hypothetical protein
MIGRDEGGSRSGTRRSAGRDCAAPAGAARPGAGHEHARTRRAGAAVPLRRALRPAPGGGAGDSPAGKNAPLAEWHWGQLSWKFVHVLNDYIRSAVGSKLRDGLANSKDVRDVEEDSGITVHPRRALEQIVRDFTVRPVETVGGLIGQPGYAPSPTPAGAKTPPIAPPEPGEEPVPDPSVPWPYGTPLPY